MFWKKKSTEDKADAIGERLLGAVPEMANIMLSELGDKYSIHLNDDQTERFLIELFVFYMHLLDRMAFARLGPAGREAFGDRLVAVVAHGLMDSLDRSISSVDFVARLRDTYNRRQVEYAGYRDLVARQDEPLKGTLFWEVGKVIWRITGDSNPVTLTMISIMISKSVPLVLDAVAAEQYLR
ncbi:MAG: hypothetical protein AAB225_04030 [Acidobacteriota bacterium]